MKNKIIYAAAALFVGGCLNAAAQAPRVAYHTDGFNFAHELNPAFQPETSYMSLPILGNTSITSYTNIDMGDIIFDGADGKLTTFMTPGTISKNDLMDKVSGGLKNTTDVRFTLLSLGRRVNEKRYQTLGITLRTEANTRLSEGFFDCMKEIENKKYDLSETGVKASSWVEIALGESCKLNDAWTVGAKGKVLVGIANANLDVDNLSIDLEQDTWTAQGKVKLNATGLDYKLKEEDYNSKPGTYNKVNGVEVGSIGFNGLGVAFDLGATYTLDDHWSFSAALLDLGFITWFKSNQAENKNESFEFNGFQDVVVPKHDENSLKNQWDRIEDDLMDLAHLEETGQSSYTSMPGVTVEGSAQYKYSDLTCGALLTGRINGKYSWAEGRLNIGYNLFKALNVVVSPAYSTFGTSVGGMLELHTKSGFQFYLASDRLFFETNKQFIPTSLCAAVQFGMSFGLGGGTKKPKTAKVVDEFSEF